MRLRKPESNIAYRRRSLLLLLALLSIVVVLAAPFLLWAYHIQQAGYLLEQALTWPDPRRADALPQLADADADERALYHLSAAAEARPEHFHAHRLMGYAYEARGEWLQSAAAFERARQFAPNHPLLAWETGLMYEQIAHIVAQTPAHPLLDRMTADVPPCPPDQLQTCSIQRTTFTLPYLLLPDASPVTTDVLAIQPPAHIARTIPLTDNATALRFLIGYSPDTHTTNDPEVTWRIWATSAETTPVLVYEYTSEAQNTHPGWLAGWADLTPWQGKTITLTLEIVPSPAAKPQETWYGWADLTLTTPQAAHLAAQLPQARMRQAWHSAGFTAAQFRSRAAQTRNAASQQLWEQRAARMDSQ